MIKKKALITGIYGQDGFYLAQLLIQKNYHVFGYVEKIDITHELHQERSITIYECSVVDQQKTWDIITQIQPDECYHLAGVSFVSYDKDEEQKTLYTNIFSTQILLTGILQSCPSCKFYLAGSGEMFGNAIESPQNENTPFNPRSAYGISKVTAYHIMKTYRQNHGLFACCGFTYNHESPRRSPLFVTRKITQAVARIYYGQQKSLSLGNIEAQRDWGYAPEYVEAMWLMLNNRNPIDYVIATGKPQKIVDVLCVAFSLCNLDYKKYLHIDTCLIRPDEHIPLIGNPQKIYNDLSWYAKKNIFDIIKEMIHFDIKILTEKRSLCNEVTNTNSM
ncbi:MAG: NAD-dependent epimerase/dehydratase [candidate division TM6 bacterium GW2011_GWF2_36_6]|nr:MAG: NAD-dependent epimerase/dehydratase [candidate division TM6 bacterium GW2011_GWF2_36_6]